MRRDRAEAYAKNTVSVGCVYHFDNALILLMIKFVTVAAKLPDESPSIKPDLVAMGDNVRTTFPFGRYEFLRHIICYCYRGWSIRLCYSWSKGCYFDYCGGFRPDLAKNFDDKPIQSISNQPDTSPQPGLGCAITEQY